MTQINYSCIPSELKEFKQWVVWRYENRDIGDTKLTKRLYSPVTFEKAAVDASSTWATYDQAVQAMLSGYWAGIGFVLTDSDPFALIDLDHALVNEGHEEYNKDSIERQIAIYNEFQSYTEVSPSGTGLHILVKASLPTGRRRSNIEIYSTLRFMTVTGNVYRNFPIYEMHTQLNTLYDRMTRVGGDVIQQFNLANRPEHIDDITVCDRAYAATNGQKFYDLYVGNFDPYYSSQSEADFALINIIAFYSKNAQQTTRIFKSSALGQRRKAERQGYISSMVNRAFDRMLPPLDIDGLRMQIEDALNGNGPQRENYSTSLDAGYTAVTMEPTQSNFDGAVGNVVLSPPPGLVGDIARFIYEQSPRPCAEIALGGALGLMAGVVGRAYNVSGTGLNQYVLVLAQTGLGKEAVSSGIDKLFSAISTQVPEAQKFIGPSSIASPQALNKQFSSGSPSFVSVVGEYGLYLQQMATDNAAPHMLGLRRMFLDLYNKSGKGRRLGGSINAEKEKNIESIIAPAFSILGESTPEKFYEGLHEGLITEGLLPRFTLLEYQGPRPAFKEDFMFTKPDESLVERFATLCANALNLNSVNNVIDISLTPDAKRMADEFNLYCDAQMNDANEVKLNLWTRCHMKALKLAGLIAVGCNTFVPTIDTEMFKWATEVVLHDVRRFIDKFDKGEFAANGDERKQLDLVVEAIRFYVVSPWDEIKKYSNIEGYALWENKILSYNYLYQKCRSLAPFRTDKIGASNAIKRAILTLCETGAIEQVDTVTMKKRFGTTAKAYMVMHGSIYS